jgi:hypothetical protein
MPSANVNETDAGVNVVDLQAAEFFAPETVVKQGGQ